MATIRLPVEHQVEVAGVVEVGEVVQVGEVLYLLEAAKVPEGEAEVPAQERRRLGARLVELAGHQGSDGAHHPSLVADRQEDGSGPELAQLPGQELDAERLLAQVRSRLSEEGVACQTHVLIRGQSAGADLVEFAKKHQVDEIILGVRKHSLLGELLAGSTERTVSEQAPCPVVLVPLA